MPKSLNTIKRIFTEHKKDFKKKYGVCEIGIFGSYVRGEAKKGSDLDVLVEFEESIDPFVPFRLEEYLSNLVGIKTHLATKKNLKPHIGRQILKEVVIL